VIPHANPGAAWRLAHGKSVPLDRPRLIAIVNLTPDSFHAGARFTDARGAADHAERVIAEGADALDLGAESTRPGATRVSGTDQLDRLLPFFRELRSRHGRAADIPVSVDTTLAEVARACLDGGADAVNDVSAGCEDAAMLPLVAARGAGIVLMHRLRPPGEDSYSDRYLAPPAYGDVVEDVRGFLARRAAAAMDAGIARDSIVIDPGLGFGKSVEQNLALIRGTGRLSELGFPVLSALSRKSFVGRISLGRDSTPEERLAGTLELSLEHGHAGAGLFRVHDVREHADAFELGSRDPANHSSATLTPPETDPGSIPHPGRPSVRRG